MSETNASRRAFLKTAALLGGSAAAASQVPGIVTRLGAAEGGYLMPQETYPLAQPENILYSVCQQCNTQCGTKVKIENGVIAKIDGNPYSPWNMVPHLPYTTPVIQAARVDGLLCPKGQAAIQTAYDPYRIVKVLKRGGKRGENKWISIPFDQAVREIVEGGFLFKHVPGEETRKVEGLRDLWALRDPKLMKALAADAAKVAKKEMTLADFKAKHRVNLKYLIDPDHPDLGPKNNQILYFWGRKKAGRSHIAHRFFGEGLGTINRHGHTTVCQGSLYFTGKAMTEQFRFDEKERKLKWTGGAKMYWMADTANSEFVIFVGASPFEGNYGPTNRAPRITQGVADGRLKVAVVDPRCSKTAAKAWRWVPIKPGTEGAMALGMVRWILEQKRYDARYLANANKAAAKADGEPTWTNAVWLVKVEKGKPGALLLASEIGLPTVTRVHKDKKTGEETPYEFDPFVVLQGGKPVAFDPNDEKAAVEGELLVDTEIQALKVKSALQVLWESAASRTIEEWAKICDIRPSHIVELAREFTSHGKKASADIHRGVSQHTNGLYNCTAWFTLNLLIGNYNWKGGMGWPSTYDVGGGKTYEAKRPDGTEEKWAQPFVIDALSPGKLSPFGISIIREGVRYEETTLFKGYPSRRPWYPLASDIYQEILPSAGDAYPYPVKAVFLYMGTPVYSLPAGNTNIEILTDVKKLPLFVASDIVIGETSMYADYIFPDVTYLERWEFSGSQPSIVWKIHGVRQPVIAPLVETVKVFGEEMPLTFEAMLLGLAEQLDLPNFGKDGFGPGQPFTHPDHLYLRMVANVAAGEKPDDAVPEATPQEMKLFLESHGHLPRTVFDPARWKAAVGPELWPKVVYVLNRGGRFEDFEKAFDGDRLKHGFKAQINLYQEKTAKTKDAMTGKPFPGVATYIPSPVDALGRPLEDEKAGYDLRLITYREIMHTKSRTAANYWLLALLPENSLLMNKRDADRLGLKDGDRVRIQSASNPGGLWDFKNGRTRPIGGRLKVVQGLRPGVIAFSLGHGHWAYGASDVVIDGRVVKGDPRRGNGIHANAAMRVDPVLKNTCLSDPAGASAVFYDTQVKVTKV
jgi:anaerobic selenocysteine-containing dehydrogenase